MTDCYNTLCICFEKKCKLFKKYLDTTLYMKQSLDSWDMKKLGILFEERDNLSKDIDEIDRKISRLKKTSPSFVEYASRLMKDRADRSLAELKTIIEELSRLESAYMEILQDKSEQLKNELLHMRSGQKAIKGYDRKLENTPKFLDMKR